MKQAMLGMKLNGNIYFSQFFVRLDHIRKCFTQEGGIFILEEFSKFSRNSFDWMNRTINNEQITLSDPKTRQIVQRKYMSSMVSRFFAWYFQCMPWKQTKKKQKCVCSFFLILNGLVLQNIHIPSNIIDTQHIQYIQHIYHQINNLFFYLLLSHCIYPCEYWLQFDLKRHPTWHWVFIVFFPFIWQESSLAMLMKAFDMCQLFHSFGPAIFGICNCEYIVFVQFLWYRFYAWIVNNKRTYFSNKTPNLSPSFFCCCKYNTNHIHTTCVCSHHHLNFSTSNISRRHNLFIYSFFFSFLVFCSKCIWYILLELIVLLCVFSVHCSSCIV